MEDPVLIKFENSIDQISLTTEGMISTAALKSSRTSLELLAFHTTIWKSDTLSWLDGNLCSLPNGKPDCKEAVRFGSFHR